MPWEGAEEKKQKQGTNNARLAYILHIHEPDYARMKILLAYAKDWKVWHKHWGNAAFSVEIPNEKSSQAEKTRYIQMVQTHGSVQLSMGAALLEGLINADTTFTLCLLPDAEGNARPPTTTSVRGIFRLMEINDKKVWICVSTGTNGATTGYFSSVVQEISEHVAAFVTCPGAQVYWWLRRCGCVTADNNSPIKHCFTLSQQQKVTASKYLKDLGHAVVEHADGDDIIGASTSEGIYDLTLGLSDKERRSLIGRGYDAAAITYGEAKEGAIKAHNFSVALFITSLHSAKRRVMEETPDPNPTLAQSVYSIGTSRVTHDSEDKSDEEEENADGDSYDNPIAIDGMDILKVNNNQGLMLFSTASMEESAQTSREENNMEEDIEEGGNSEHSEVSWQEDAREVSHLAEKMKKATSLLQLSSDKEEGSDFQESNMSFRSDDLDLKLSDYDSVAQEVSLGEFDTKFVKKYSNPKSFLHALWNAAGPSVGAMRIYLEIIKEELTGQLAGIPAEFKDLPEQLINFMHKEAGEDPNDAMDFITHVHYELSKFEDNEEKETTVGHMKTIAYHNRDAITPDIANDGKEGAQEEPSKHQEEPDLDTLEVVDKGTQETASKTQGPLPGAHQTGPAEGAVIEPATKAGGDKEGVQSTSMAQGG